METVGNMSGLDSLMSAVARSRLHRPQQEMVARPCPQPGHAV